MTNGGWELTMRTATSRAGSRIRLATLIIVAGLYTPALTEMASAWWNHPYAGHGMFVPLFSAFIAWKERDRLRAAAGPGSRVGSPVILLSLGILAFGRHIESLLVQGLAVTVAVAGVVLWTRGASCLRRAAFPVGFLVFMAPLPRVVVDAVTRDIQLFAARSAGAALDLLGISFYQHGMVIDLATVRLNVAEVCNGLRFLMALLVLAIAFAQVSQRSLPRKLLVAGSAIPIAVFANVVRVATIAVAVHYMGPAAASGLIHNGIAKTVWALTLILLLTFGLLLRRGGSGALRGGLR
jgi:exosortase